MDEDLSNRATLKQASANESATQVPARLGSRGAIFARIRAGPPIAPRQEEFGRVRRASLGALPCSRRSGESVPAGVREMARNLAAGRKPDAVVTGDVAQRLGERLDPVRLADEEGVERDAHHGA